MSYTRAEQAARNNALWCDAVCRAHGRPGQFRDELWLNRHPVPRFYPNAVTLASPRDAVAQLAGIQELIAAEIPGGWAVKDSFCALDLARLGFRARFEASWIWRPASLARPSAAVAGVRWASVEEPAALAEWEAAWDGLAVGEQVAPQARIFLPALLADRDIRFVAAYRGQRIVAGAIANRTDDVVGLSNVFAPADDAPLFWAGCVAAIADAFPGVPLVGYERGDDLALVRALGFEALGPLRIWGREQGT